MSDPLRPTLMTRLRANLGGEQDAKVLEALRQAGKAAYHELMQAERLRAELSATGATVWTAPPGAASQLLAAWNAGVLQALGEAIIDGGYAANRRTVGYLPPVTFSQAWTWLSDVDGWLQRARRAAGNPGYDIAAELTLPVALEVGPVAVGCPAEHRSAMLQTVAVVREHAETALLNLERGVPPEAGRAVAGVRELAGLAAAGVDYIDGLRVGYDDERLHNMLDQKVRTTLELWFQVGQLAAMPQLLAKYRVPRAATLLNPARLPGGKAFDPWCLTDPASLAHWRADPQAGPAIAAMWRNDPNPADTLAVKLEIDAGLAAGDVVRYRTAIGTTCYFKCPWSTLYEVRRPLRIAGQSLRVLETFAYAIDTDATGRFTRAIVTGPFAPAWNARLPHRG